MIPSLEEEIRDLHGLFGSARDPEGRAFVPLADAYRRAGDPSRALEVLESGLERHPDLAAAHLVSGLVCRDLADDGGAERAFRRVLELDSDNARALIGLGRVLSAAGDAGEGQALIERALALDGSLGASGAPARVPRHSSNPEVVGNGEAAVDEAENHEAPLEAMEWEVIDIGSLEPSAQDGAAVELPEAADEIVVDVSALQPEPPSESGSAVIDIADLSPDAAAEEAPAPSVAPQGSGSDASPLGAVADISPMDPDPVAERADASEASDIADATDAADLPAAFDLSAMDAGEGTAEGWEGSDLDIDWGVPQPPEPATDEASEAAVSGAAASEPAASDPPAEVDAAASDDAAAAVDDAEVESEAFPAAEAVVPPDAGAQGGVGAIEAPEAEVVESEVVDLADLAPDDAAAEALAPPDGDLLMDLADLAPDIEPGSRHHDDDDEEEALPTRTLGELYARQGLRSEAVRVFEALVARSPGDADLRARLDELRGMRQAPAPSAAPRPRVPSIEAPIDDDPPVTEFFAELLGWSPDEPADGRPPEADD